MDEKVRETLTKYLGDLRALEDHGNKAIVEQIGTLRSKNHPEALRACVNFKQTLDNHLTQIDSRLKTLGGSPTSPVKDVVAGAAGVIAGIYGSLRNEAAAKMMRDDYAFLSLDTICYLMLHTTAMSLGDSETAALAARGYRDCAQQIMEIDRIMPTVLLQELREDGFNAKDITADCHRLIDESWQSHSRPNIASPQTAATSEATRTGQR